MLMKQTEDLKVISHFGDPGIDLRTALVLIGA
jgi:hypothetical protein